MKKKVVGVLVIIALALAGCEYFQSAQGRTETMVISYESIGTIAFPTVLAYLQQREKNGSLVGDDLVKAKAGYAQAKQVYIQAGNAMIQIVEGTGKQVTSATVATMLRQVAVMLANLSGGKVEGNNLTVPKVGGK